MEFRKLSDLGVKLSTGQIQARKECKGSEAATFPCPVLVPRAIEDGTVNRAYLSSFRASREGKDELKLTKKGDIVIKCSTPYNACIILEGDEGLFIPSFCILIENDGVMIDSYYLLAFLNSKGARDALSSCGVGQLTIINKKILDDLVIPCAPLEEQRLVGERYKKSVEKAKSLKRILELEEEWRESYFEGGEAL